MARQDIPSKTDGSAKYGLDVRVPGMVYAVIKHCPAFGGTLVAQPATPSGMLAVVPVKVIAGTGRGTEVTGAVNAVAVVRFNTWDVWQAAKRLSVSWAMSPPASSLNSAKFLNDAQALAVSAPAYVAGGANPPGTLYTVEGEPGGAAVSAALTSSAKVVDSTYTRGTRLHGSAELHGELCARIALRNLGAHAVSEVCAATRDDHHCLVGPLPWTAAGLPAGLSLLSGGVVTGTPTTAGTYDAVLTVKDSLGTTAVVSVNISATPGCTVPVTATKNLEGRGKITVLSGNLVTFKTALNVSVSVTVPACAKLEWNGAKAFAIGQSFERHGYSTALAGNVATEVTIN